ncbi:MAG TPA: response regulator transcription factor [Gemmatimonadales bacterium]|jgi:two-component system response regulator MtrA
MARILVVEDQPALAELVARNLVIEGFETRTLGDGREVLPLVRSWRPDLVILDLMLPGLDGFEVLRALRGVDRTLPVIILSARAEEPDKIRGFRLDADQYVTKPFGVLELLERVHALLRRAAARDANDATAQITFGTIAIDVAAHTVTRGGAPVMLSPKAFALLLALVRRDGGVANRATLLREVWGYQALVLSRTVDSHVAELRRKLEDDPATPRHIVTVFKTGYRFQA